MLKITRIQFSTPVGTAEQVSAFFERETGGYVPELKTSTGTELFWEFDGSILVDAEGDFGAMSMASELFYALQVELRDASGWGSVGTDTD